MRLVFLFVTLLIFGAGCKPSTVSYDRSVNRHFHSKKVGASARDLLTAERFTSLTIEVQYMPGVKPEKEALDNLKIFLEDLVHKPTGIFVTNSQILPVTDSVLTLDEIITVENANRKFFTDTSNLTIYIVFTNGYFDEQKLLGYAYRNTSIAIPGKNISQHSGEWGRLSKAELETRILQHEMGHLLGLTNMGTTMTKVHCDHTKGQHCKNKQCLMYAKMETTDYPAYLLKKDRPALDEDCINDLQANGGKKNGYYYVSLVDILEKY